ncbi:MAG: ATP-binding protein, partial [bacterium]|nr:ATP-binding protein [bacterium]
EATFFTGVRRSGKTSAMYYLIEQLLKKVKKQNILYLNLDDDVLQFAELSEIYTKYKELFPTLNGKVYIFLDEVQNIDSWERWVKNIYDSFDNVKFIISGSKSYLLKKKSTLLTGRMIEFEIYPLSFKEFLYFNNVDHTDVLLRLNKHGLFLSLFKEFIKYGGFPEVVMENDSHMKTILSKEYYDNIKNKDIITYFNIKESKKFERLSLFVISNISKPLSANKIGSLVNLSTSVVNNYLDFSEMMYFFLPLQHFNYSIKGQITKPRKIYSIDTGMVNSVAFQFSENIGRFIENIVYLELKRRCNEVYYYNNRYECDFIIKTGLNVTAAIQVCYELNDDNIKREQSGLLEAMKIFNLTEGIILTLVANKKSTNEKIKIVSIIDWLLGG